MQDGKIRMNIDDTLYTPTSEELNSEEELKLTEKEEQYIEELFNSTVKNYEKYLELNPKAEDKEFVQNQIKSIKESTLQD